MFIDTLNISNLYTGGLGADFDGDQMTVKGVFTEEANRELLEFRNSKKNFINFGGSNLRTVAADVVQSLYNLTKVLNEDKKKLSSPIF
jgi:DNA-directed RNA polymerase beta' subunit